MKGSKFKDIDSWYVYGSLHWLKLSITESNLTIFEQYLSGEAFVCETTILWWQLLYSRGNRPCKGQTRFKQEKYCQENVIRHKVPKQGKNTQSRGRALYNLSISLQYNCSFLVIFYSQEKSKSIYIWIETFLKLITSTILYCHWG